MLFHFKIHICALYFGRNPIIRIFDYQTGMRSSQLIRTIVLSYLYFVIVFLYSRDLKIYNTHVTMNRKAVWRYHLIPAFFIYTKILYPLWSVIFSSRLNFVLWSKQVFTVRSEAHTLQFDDIITYLKVANNSIYLSPPQDSDKNVMTFSADLKNSIRPFFEPNRNLTSPT